MTQLVSVETPTLSELERDLEYNLHEGLRHIKAFMDGIEELKQSEAWKESGHDHWEDYYNARWKDAHIKTWAHFRGMKREVPVEIQVEAELGIAVNKTQVREALRGLPRGDDNNTDVAVSRIRRAVENAKSRGVPFQTKHISAVVNTHTELSTTGAVSVGGDSVDPEARDIVTLSEYRDEIESHKRNIQRRENDKIAKNSLLRFTIPIHPIPKQSTRFNSATGHSYTPARLKNYIEELQWRILPYQAKSFGDKPVTVELWFYRGNGRKVDCDNLAKPVMDAMQGIMFADDKQVMDLLLHKRVASKGNARIEVAIQLYVDSQEMVA